MKQKLFFLLSLLSMAFGSAWAQDVQTVTYALAVGNEFTSGQEVSVTNDADEVVATIVYGEKDGNAFKAAVAENHVSGFPAYTAGNGTDGNKPGGTFYTIKPLVDGTIDVAVVLNADKKFYVLEDGTALSDFNGFTVAEKYYGTYTFAVKAGSSYKIYCAGSKLGFYGFKFNIGATNPDDPEEPEEPTPGISKTWNFSNWEAGEIAETTTIDGLTVNASSKAKVSIDENNKTYDGVSYTQRLKFGGSGNASTRNLSFELPANTKVTIIATSASGSGDPRPLKLATGSFGSVVASVNCHPGAISELTYANTGKTTTAYVYSGNSGINLYAIYLTPVTDEEVINVEIGSAEYATLYYSDKALKFPANVTACYIPSIDENNVITLTAIEGGIIPAGTGVVLQGKPNKYEFIVKNVNLAAPENNLLKGSDDAATTEGGDKYYKLAVKDDVVGFYYGAENGGAFENGAHKAYLAVSGEAAAKFYVFDGQATGINTVAKIAEEGVIYNLQGVRVDAQNMVKGIYVVNGKKVVIK